jgi:hypothetical protein
MGERETGNRSISSQLANNFDYCSAGHATLAHRMGEGLGVRVTGEDICVHLRNLRSTPFASFASFA